MNTVQKIEIEKDYKQADGTVMIIRLTAVTDEDPVTAKARLMGMLGAQITMATVAKPTAAKTTSNILPTREDWASIRFLAKEKLGLSGDEEISTYIMDKLDTQSLEYVSAQELKGLILDLQQKPGKEAFGNA